MATIRELMKRFGIEVEWEDHAAPQRSYVPVNFIGWKYTYWYKDNPENDLTLFRYTHPDGDENTSPDFVLLEKLENRWVDDYSFGEYFQQFGYTSETAQLAYDIYTDMSEESERIQVFLGVAYDIFLNAEG